MEHPGLRPFIRPRRFPQDVELRGSTVHPAGPFSRRGDTVCTRECSALVSSNITKERLFMSKMITVMSMTAVLCGGVAAAGWAQLTAAQEGPVVYGHHHLIVSSTDEHKKFWVDTLGGELVTVGTLEIVKFPNVLVFMR